MIFHRFMDILWTKNKEKKTDWSIRSWLSSGSSLLIFCSFYKNKILLLSPTQSCSWPNPPRLFDERTSWWAQFLWHNQYSKIFMLLTLYFLRFFNACHLALNWCLFIFENAYFLNLIYFIIIIKNIVCELKSTSRSCFLNL